MFRNYAVPELTFPGNKMAVFGNRSTKDKLSIAEENSRHGNNSILAL